MNLERLKLTNCIDDDAYCITSGAATKVLLQQFCKISGLKWIDFYINRECANYLHILKTILKKPRLELIIRYNADNRLILHGIDFREKLIAFIRNINKSVTDWMIVIKWIESAEFHETLNNISIEMNLSYTFNKLETEYCLTKANHMDRNMRKYYDIKWIMTCRH